MMYILDRIMPSSCAGIPMICFFGVAKGGERMEECGGPSVRFTELANESANDGIKRMENNRTRTKT